MPLSLDGHLFDPFDSYPKTNLPRLRVQVLSKIAFQYYPLELNPASNPFLASWWPLSLHDPLLFHVTLQTASWDDEMNARRGFPHSELLMKDSVSLLRHRVQDQSLAFRDATMNAVITLAAIEGNMGVSKMHIDGVKRMVGVRGGLTEVKKTSPLTARMVPWVSLLVTCLPQFEAQDDSGAGDGVSTIQEWQLELPLDQDASFLDLSGLGIDPVVERTLTRLRCIFGERSSKHPGLMSTTDFHDLTCFILHRLLNLHPPTSVDPFSANTSECLRFGITIHMLTAHGPTYYSHANFLRSLLLQFKHHLEHLDLLDAPDSFMLWSFSIAAVAAIGMNELHWFREQLSALFARLNLRYWEDFKTHLKKVLWLEARSEIWFQQLWEEIT
ncbi:hypothetical protein D0Z07_1534 [Hyphodiscus hymeniophilus]|uniref:Uncharacterized protein n=1 Tax=Hyphodiscus hymeniophilus TaxID=353542 RepID=A0A9P7AZX1_9HELO|nr:hypothetical protein D0Z07_1534 [Hyphodiscus hymeniophilus]